MHGYARKLGDFVNTDEHASDKYLPAGMPVEEVRKQMFSSLRPGFADMIRPGDFIVAGKGFGTVSPRVDAAVNIMAVGVSAVIASSFGMLFFRNAINVGLPCIECDTSAIPDGAALDVDLAAGAITADTGIVISFTPFPPVITKLLGDGGLLAHIRKHNGYLFQDSMPVEKV